jgi:putative redox protein
LHDGGLVKIILTSDDSIRLVPDAGPMTIEAASVDAQYSPFHMLGSSLAYCTFSVMYSWATHTKQGADDLIIDVTWKFSEDEPKRVASMTLTYIWPSLPEKKREAARRVAELCTVHATLMHPPAIAIGSAT